MITGNNTYEGSINLNIWPQYRFGSFGISSFDMHFKKNYQFIAVNFKVKEHKDVSVFNLKHID